MNYIVTVTPKVGDVERILTWATSPQQAIKQVADFLLCPDRICTAEPCQ